MSITILLLPLGVAFVISLVLTPLIRRLATAQGWVDRPDGSRKLHATPIPRLGGVAVYLSFLIASVVLLVVDPAALGDPAAVRAYVHLLAGSAAVMLVGVCDDVWGVRPRTKIAVQAAAALYLYFHGYRIEGISNPLAGGTLDLGALALPVTLLWFVGMSNAFNLIDGLDGLAAGVGLFATVTLFIAALVNERWEIALICCALAGAMFGFLRYNFSPASIFMGDSGSLFVGFALAAIAVRGSMKSSAAIAVTAPLMALAVPLLDAGIAVARRVLSGRDPFAPDGDHVHHRLLRMGMTPRKVVLVVYAVAAGFGALSLLTMTDHSQIIGIVVIASSLLTWLGIQQLGYLEFGDVQRILKQKLFLERASTASLRIATLRTQVERAADPDALWRALTDTADALEFDALELGWDFAALPRRAWKRAGTPSPGPAARWEIPLEAGGRRVGMVQASRPLARLEFDPAAFLDVMRMVGARLRALETAPAGSASTDPPPASRRLA